MVPVLSNPLDLVLGEPLVSFDRVGEAPASDLAAIFTQYTSVHDGALREGQAHVEVVDSCATACFNSR